MEVPGKTTRGFIPGPIKSGQWAAELGVGAVIAQPEGDADGKVKWRVEIELSEDPAFKDEPYRPARYDERPVRRDPGWYAGDMHVHAEHSNYGAATMSETFGFGFRPLAQGGAGLDFITLSDYVSGYPAWNEIGRYQQLYPRNLVVRSDEVITYRGHTNNHASARFVDYRTTPVYERLADGSLRLLRARRDPKEIFREVQRAGGWTQINHPQIFEPVNPTIASLCRGCFWEYSEAETDYSKVDAYELATGPWNLGGSPNPFTVTAIAAYERLLGLGYRIAAVGSSDSHKAGEVSGLLEAPVGQATTVVYAPELSEAGLRCGVQARHTYVKVSGNAGPDLRFSAAPGATAATRRSGRRDPRPGRDLPRRVKWRGQHLCRQGRRDHRHVPITSADFRYRFDGSGSGRWRLQIEQGRLIQSVSSPIWRQPGRRVERTLPRVPGKDW